MKRELKFRIWDIEANKYLENGRGFDIMECAYDGAVDIEQYTGISDVDHKEIYEGDILKAPCSGDITDIIYENGSWTSSIWGRNPIWRGWKIVGNVHENYDLIQQQLDKFKKEKDSPNA